MIWPVLFTSDNSNEYLYDVLDNQIVYLSQANKSLYEKIIAPLTAGKAFPDGLTAHSDESLEIGSILKNYVAWNRWLKNATVPDRFDFAGKKNSRFNLSQLILKVTERCNFHCTYCCYSDSSSEAYKECDPPDMTFSIAKKSIDYAFSVHNASQIMRRNDKMCVSFYGGEPLLVYSMISKIIEYIDTTYSLRNVTFNITTNLSLLTNKMIDDFIDRKIKILISLDGPKSEHDKCRVDAHGRGTYDLVIKGIKKIKKRDFKYFDQYVGFCSVYTTYHDLGKIKRYFDRSGMSKNLLINTATNLNQNFENKMIRYPLFNPDIHYRAIKRSFVNTLKRKKITSTFSANFVKSVFDRFNNRIPVYADTRMKRFESGDMLPCVPGAHKIFVTPDGKFHICEKVNSHFFIGDYRSGVDRRKVNRIAGQYYRQVISKCLSCIAMSNCSECFASLCHVSDFLSTDKCEKKRNNMIPLLREYVSLREDNRSLFTEQEKWKASTSI